MADVVGAAGFFHQLQIPGDLSPLAFGADATVAVSLGVVAVVDVAPSQQGVDLAVGDNGLPQSFGAKHGLPH